MMDGVRRLLPAATPALLVILAAAPATRWILARQAAPGNDSLPITRAESLPLNQMADRKALLTLANRQFEAAAAHSSDYRIQLGAAIATWQPSYALPRLRRLELAFPDRASAPALALRFAAAHDIVINRLEEGILDPTGMVYRAGSPPARPDSAQLSAFERDAAAGRRLQPDNAWFPLMAAAGWCAGRADDRALAALSDAARCSRFSAATADAVTAVWAAAALTYGGLTGTDQMALLTNIHMWQYVRIRDLVRWATARAIELEQKGDFAGGLRIREEAAACASLMIVGARTPVGRLVGSAIFEIAMARPGGAPAPAVGSGEAQPAARLAAFMAYLSRHGWSNRAAPWKTEMVAVERMRAIATVASGSAGPAEETVPVNRRLAVIWLAARIVLYDWLWLFAMWAAAKLAARWRTEAVGGLVLVAALAALTAFCGWVATAASTTTSAALLVVLQGSVPVAVLVGSLASATRANRPAVEQLSGVALAASTIAGLAYVVLLFVLLPINFRERGMVHNMLWSEPAVAARSAGIPAPVPADWRPLLTAPSRQTGIG
ncbi:MAG: hypothetical protein KGJ62_09695 [Armatimonadetes bacterium]|nr:hypothetical protein [Armatimonadota bacterium]MDE2205781.1 hypothetical protein [Armatimonadota bacterium]